jgi:hypothetical protein
LEILDHGGTLIVSSVADELWQLRRQVGNRVPHECPVKVFPLVCHNPRAISSSAASTANLFPPQKSTLPSKQFAL